MKCFALLFAVVSFTAIAAPTAPEALQLVLPQETYEGNDRVNEKCVVDIIYGQGRTRIELENTDVTRFLLLPDAKYVWDLEKKFFSSSTSLISNGGRDQIETTFSTAFVSTFQREVSFQRVFRSGDRVWTSKQNCIIDL